MTYADRPYGNWDNYMVGQASILNGFNPLNGFREFKFQSRLVADVTFFSNFVQVMEQVTANYRLFAPTVS